MYLSSIQSFVKYLNDYHSLNIVLKGAQSVKVPKSLPKPLQYDNIIEVLNSEDEKTALIIKIFYGLGLRISELASIKLSDFQGNFLRVTGKGNKTREVPVLPTLQRDIEHYLKVYTPKIYLFEKDGVSMKDTQIRYVINKIFKKHGIKATPHQLRHSFASHLLEQGARISDVSELLGHSSMASTQIYTKLTNTTKLENYLKAHPLAKEN
jgi:integrase/recombinase XerC